MRDNTLKLTSSSKRIFAPSRKNMASNTSSDASAGKRIRNKDFQIVQGEIILFLTVYPFVPVLRG